MSHKIDVLAVMADASEILGRDGYSAIPNNLNAARAAVADVFSKAEAAWQTIANAIAAEQIDARYADVYLDLRAALAEVQP